MTASTGKQLAVGMRMARAYQLNAAGLPAATSTAVYEGTEFGGAKAFEMTAPDARKIMHIGNDRVLALDYLPPNTMATGVLHVARSEMALNASLMNVKSFTTAETTWLPWNTDQQGSEINIGMLTFQQSLDAASKLRAWRFFIMPSCRVLPKTAGQNENASEFLYDVAPNPTSKHLWGASLATGTEGALEASIMEGMSEYRPHIVAWLADGNATDFLLPTDKPNKAATKAKAWVNGAPVTATFSVLTQVTPTVKPSLNDLLVVYYEY